MLSSASTFVRFYSNVYLLPQNFSPRGISTFSSITGSILMNTPLFNSTKHEEVNKQGLKPSVESVRLFQDCWWNFMSNHGLERLRLASKVIFLNGAPGCGKGANSQYISANYGLKKQMCMSSLLAVDPKAKTLIDKGDMVPDPVVGNILIKTLLCNSNESILVDGFPRTRTQAEFLLLLYNKLHELHESYSATPWNYKFPKPEFSLLVLYVDESTSIQRQMQRALSAKERNRQAELAGRNEREEVRTTDLDPALCKKRYELFERHYQTLQLLGQTLPLTTIDAMGSLHKTRTHIVNRWYKGEEAVLSSRIVPNHSWANTVNGQQLKEEDYVY